MIILIGGEKGGTGKTTIATNLAAVRSKSGHDVLLLDADRQGTASLWAQVRDDVQVEPRVPCVQKFGKGLPKDVLDLANRYEDIIIDAGGRDSIELRYALGIANAAFIPVQSTQFDLWSLQHMDDLIEQAQSININLSAYIIINRASTNPGVSDTSEAVEYLSNYERLNVLETIVRERVVFQRCVRGGRSVVETTPEDKKASLEIKSLYKEIYHD